MSSASNSDTPKLIQTLDACNVKGSWGAGIAKAFKQKVCSLFFLFFFALLGSTLCTNRERSANIEEMQYPAAFQCYKEHCEEYQQDSAHHDIVDLQSDDDDTISVRLPLGTALVIPPQPEDYSSGKKRHWIVCLFTSSGFGSRVDSPESILNSTFAALQDLDMQLVLLKEQTEGADDEQPPGELYSCRFNSGLFAVPWEQTRDVIDDVGLSMTVIYPEGE